MELSYEEMKLSYVQSMGPELGLLYARLSAECTHLHVVWGEYVALFGTDEETINLLNQAAPAFARIVQDSLWESVLLGLCRLIDSSLTMKKGNLTIRRLADLAHHSLKPELQEAIQEVIVRSKFAKDWRDRHIAHRDLDLSMGRPGIPLAAASRIQVKSALQTLCKTLNIVELHYMKTHGSWGVIGPIGGASSLFCVIKGGLKFEEARRKRLIDRCPLPDDFD